MLKTPPHTLCLMSENFGCGCNYTLFYFSKSDVTITYLPVLSDNIISCCKILLKEHFGREKSSRGKIEKIMML